MVKCMIHFVSYILYHKNLYICKMKEIINPFPVSGYHGNELFCDREEETEKLFSNAVNGVKNPKS